MIATAKYETPDGIETVERNACRLDFDGYVVLYDIGDTREPTVSIPKERVLSITHQGDLIDQEVSPIEVHKQ